MASTSNGNSAIILTGLGGGPLCELLVSPQDQPKLMKESADLVEWCLTRRQLCDAELLLNGGFTPLKGFMNKGDYEGVVKNLRLESGTVWPMPINLDVDEKFAKSLKLGQNIRLVDEEGNLIAVQTVESIYKPDKAAEANHVFGSPDDTCHPSIKYLLEKAGDWYIGGTLRGYQLPIYYDFRQHRRTPRELRTLFAQSAWSNVVFFQTRNPLHRSHRELTMRAAKQCSANLVLHPSVGMTKPGDVDHYTRVRCYLNLMPHYPEGMAMLSLLPLAMRMGGPREALWHMIIRKNFGATHFIIGRDHAGPGPNKHGKDFYGPYDAQELAKKYMKEVGCQVVDFKMVVYLPGCGEYRPVDEVEKDTPTATISGTELRRRLYKGIEIPDWFSFPGVVEILRKSYPARTKQGFTIFFTGLSGSGKSTIANALRVKLLEEGSRPVTLLDGDVIRRNLSSELGFSREHRDINIRRIAYVASEITKARGIAITAAISPYEAPRLFARDIISSTGGGFIEVYVSTPLSECERRDRKGLYARARAGEIKEFTGISDPYEIPKNPELTIDASKLSVAEAVHKVILYLETEGYLGDPTKL